MKIALLIAVSFLFLSRPLFSQEKEKYIVSIWNTVVDKQPDLVENQILLSVSNISSSPKDEDNIVFIRLEAVAETAKKKIRKASCSADIFFARISL